MLHGDRRAQRVVGGPRKERHDRIADVLVDDPAVFAHRGAGAFKQLVDEPERLARRHRFGERRERTHVGEEHRHLALDAVAERDVAHVVFSKQFQELARDEARVRHVERADLVDRPALREIAFFVGRRDTVGDPERERQRLKRRSQLDPPRAKHRRSREETIAAELPPDPRERTEKQSRVRDPEEFRDPHALAERLDDRRQADHQHAERCELEETIDRPADPRRDERRGDDDCRESEEGAIETRLQFGKREEGAEEPIPESGHRREAPPEEPALRVARRDERRACDLKRDQHEQVGAIREEVGRAQHRVHEQMIDPDRRDQAEEQPVHQQVVHVPKCSSTAWAAA